MGIEPNRITLLVNCKSNSGRELSVDVSTPAVITADEIRISTPAERSVDLDGMHCKGEIKVGTVNYSVNGSDLTITSQTGDRMLLKRITH